MKLKLPAKLTSRKLWVLILFAIFEVLNQEFGWGLETAQIKWTVLAYLGGQSIVDSMSK